MQYIRSFETADKVNGVDLCGYSAVVIDILRATTSITTACANGCRQIYPVKTVENVFELAKQFPAALKAGERGGKRVDGFDLGNSPREYHAEIVQDQTIIFTTTNGTRALVNAESADAIWVAAFLNVQSIADAVLQSGKHVAVIQAGTEGEFTLEDAVCAGYLIKALLTAKKWKLDEKSEKALQLAEEYPHALDALYASQHGQNLIQLGFEQDLAICAQLNALDIQPVYKNKIIQYS